ncbi:MAG: ArsR/SmtB family transcription factor [Bacillota bacterium]
MKFNFNKDVSRILDYLSFPSIYFAKNKHEHLEEDMMYEVIKTSYVDFIEKMKQQLAPYKEEIAAFFPKDLYTNHDYVHILTSAFPVYDYRDEHTYLEDVLATNDTDFKTKMIHALITIEDDDTESSDTPGDEPNAMQHINSLNIDSANKWNLLMMIQEPKTYLKRFIALLNRVQSLFYSYYKEKESAVEASGTRLATRFSEDTIETFKTITYDSISYDFASNGACQLYISAVFPYTLRLSTGDDCRIVWGLEMEYAFQKTHEIKEDKLTERVKIFKALGDKTRYSTLRLIASGVTSIKGIANELDVSSATISYHVNEFLTSGIVKLNFEKSKKSGYKIDYDKVDEVIKALLEDLEVSE